MAPHPKIYEICISNNKHINLMILITKGQGQGSGNYTILGCDHIRTLSIFWEWVGYKSDIIVDNNYICQCTQIHIGEICWKIYRQQPSVTTHWFGDRSYYNTNMNKGRYLIKKKSANWRKISFTKLTFINIIWSRHCLNASTAFLPGQCVYI